ncbi:MAG: hypothetical protein HYY18_06260 [Planctomycetes bacterium]|nr:hypothetical protein [Planctomycetota bacterium]
MIDAFRRGCGFAVLTVMVVLASAPPLRAEDEPKEEKAVAKTPQEAFDQFKVAVKKKDKERFWTLLSKDSQKQVEEMAAMMSEASEDEKSDMAEKLGITLDELAKLSPKDLMLAVLFAADNAENLDEIEKSELADVKEDGDKAAGTRIENKGDKEEKKERAFFVKEDGEWKLDLAREMKEGHEGDDGGREEEEK